MTVKGNSIGQINRPEQRVNFERVKMKKFL